MSPAVFEAIAVVFGIVSVYLSVRENIWSWPTAIVNVGMYILVFHRARLYADMGLQVFYVAISVYGWYEWLHGGAGRTELTVSRGTRRLFLFLLGLGLVSAAALGTLLARFTNASLPYVDSATTTTSLIVQLMMARKVLEKGTRPVGVDLAQMGMVLGEHLR